MEGAGFDPGAESAEAEQEQIDVEERRSTLAAREAQLSRRERAADERERLADERERAADTREQLADEREHRLGYLEHRLRVQARSAGAPSVPDQLEGTLGEQSEWLRRRLLAAASNLLLVEEHLADFRERSTTGTPDKRARDVTIAKRAHAAARHARLAAED